ncbi:MAG: hypothetical protein HC887_07385 [Desulfobacteraceae bacterium]|nr:hypothetical protein [Desulfobacteraceae bacterium]
MADDLWEKQNRSYFLWEFGKPPEVVVEIVSNTKGGETDSKFKKYARMGVLYYIIFDPQQLVQSSALRLYELTSGGYISRIDRRMTHVGLGITLWKGVFEGSAALWLRWCDAEGKLIPTGFELSEQEKQRADAAEKEADNAKQRAESAEKEAALARERAEKLAEKLRQMGIDPNL